MPQIRVQDLHNRKINTRRVKVLLAEKDLTISGLARLLRVPITTAHKAVNGLRPGSRLLPFIAVALKVPLSDILIPPKEKQSQEAA